MVAWYGKLPSLGDFASRRFDPQGLEVFDDWLATGLSAWQQAEPDHWLQAYLASPCWRFLALPGSLWAGSPAQAGVMMPSLDRVGRYFPFLMLQPLRALPDSREALSQLLSWLHRLDDLAVDALQEDWPVDQLEEALAAASREAPAWAIAAEVHDASGPVAGGGDLAVQVPAAGEGWRALDPAADLAAHLSAAACSAWQRAWQGQVWWWCVDAQGRHRLSVTEGLPRGTAFMDLMKPLAAAQPEGPA